MMTIKLAEMTGQTATSATVEVPSNVLAQLEELKKEVAQLKQEVAQAGDNLSSSKPPVTRPTKSNKAYRVDRNKVNAILQEAVENPELARTNLIRLQNAWGEIIESLGGADKALLIGSQPVAANENHAILAFESAFNAEQTMKRDNLNTMFGNILSNAAGFSPEILAISLEEWTKIRAEFSSKARGQKAEVPTEEESVIPKEFDFLSNKITVQND